MAPEPAQLPCDMEIDYSEISGRRILPFVIELDTASSVLQPGPGQNQRFCYNVTGVGSDTSLYADLSHLVLGICDEIPASQIVNITVVIDGEAQEVEFGPNGNVQLRPPESPDPPTGCPGLKFDFGLDKVDGEMTFCFELTVPRQIGPNVVCLFGGGVTANQLSICGPLCETLEPCSTAVGYQTASLCVPVTVRPFAIPGDPIVTCCGPPIITPGSGPCSGTLNGACTFTITQSICISVPVEFGATAEVGDLVVQCGIATSENVCTGCEAPNGLSTRRNLMAGY